MELTRSRRDYVENFVSARDHGVDGLGRPTTEACESESNWSTAEAATSSAAAAAAASGRFVATRDSNFVDGSLSGFVDFRFERLPNHAVQGGFWRR